MPVPETAIPIWRFKVLVVSEPPKVIVLLPTAPVGAVAPVAVLEVLMTTFPEPPGRLAALLSWTKPP